MDHVLKTIRSILCSRFDISESEVTPEADMIKDLGLDSLDYSEVVMEFEQAFDIRIPDEDGSQMRYVKDIVHYIENRLKSKENS